MIFFALKKELRNQVQATAECKQCMDNSVETVKQNIHDKVTSPASLISSFAAGATAGWLVTCPENGQSNEVQSTEELEEALQAAGASTKPSLLSKIKDELIIVCVGVARAETSRVMTEMIQNSASASQTTDDSAP